MENEFQLGKVGWKWERTIGSIVDTAAALSFSFAQHSNAEVRHGACSTNFMLANPFNIYVVERQEADSHNGLIVYRLRCSDRFSHFTKQVKFPDSSLASRLWR